MTVVLLLAATFLLGDSVGLQLFLRVFLVLFVLVLDDLEELFIHAHEGEDGAHVQF